MLVNSTYTQIRNGTMREYNHVLGSFGGASPSSVIPQPGDEAVCEDVRGYSCMTITLPKGLHLEVTNTNPTETQVFPVGTTLRHW